ncbi:hypothetical protein [Algivirga pacifica]|uniref:Uncharacterized protein n=1 Tax=Algivirga pacifica TaxID=1162670 RepID=A0ABP9CYB7_9BACT
MTNNYILNKLPLHFIIPLTLLLVSAGLAYSSLMLTHPTMAIGVTYDLTLTVPLLYLFLIRKKSISKLSVMPFLIAGLVIGTLLIPVQQQGPLNLFKTYLFPVVELLVVAVVAYKVRKGIIHAKGNKTADVYENIKQATIQITGSTKLGKVMAMEIGAFYYALLAWRSPEKKSNTFTSYQKNGVTALLVILFIILLVETFALHLLIARWSTIVAWVLSILSIYTAVQLFAHLKALRMRHTEITSDVIILKLGLFGDMRIPLDAIEKIETTSKRLEDEERSIEQFALLPGLESHNLILHFKTPQVVEKAYGIQKQCDILMLHIDQKEEFVKAVVKE